MIERRAPRWQTAHERARVAALLLDEAEALVAEAAPDGFPVPPAAAEPVPELPPAPVAAAEPVREPPPAPVAAAPAPDPATAALVALAADLARRGLWARAVPPLREAVARDAGCAEGWTRLGDVLNHLDDLDGARDAFERAVALDGRCARALHGCGVVLDRLGRPDEATRMYRRARDAGRR